MCVSNRGLILLSHACVVFGLSHFSMAHAQTVAQVNFSPEFLDFGGGARLDVSKFSKGNLLEPGIYAYDVFVNDSWIGREDVKVVGEVGGAENKICFNGKQVERWGVNAAALPYPKEFAERVGGDGCIDINKLIPDIDVSAVMSDLMVRVTIPQAYMKRNVRGYVSPESWDSGMTAGYINYSLNAYRTNYRDYESNTSAFGLINTGFNIGEWRLRNNSSYQYESGSGTKYRSINAYAQRDIIPIYSTLTLGEHYSIGRVFSSVPYTGVEIFSSEMMLPDSQSGFAPVIRGVADTNAKVGIYQDGVMVYETNVTPGPFTIDDLSNTGVSGNLEVVVTESNGQIKRSIVPYASVVQLLRPGTSRYSMVVGRYRDKNLDRLPNFIEGTYQRGISNMVSAYGGLIFAEDYYSAQYGMAFNTAFGAISTDATHSSARNLPRSWLNQGGNSDGQSYSVSYSKLVSETNTNLTLAAYRFSSRGFLNLDDFARARSAEKIGLDVHAMDNYYGNLFPQRNRFQVSINQDLGRFGSMYLSGSTQSYWNSTLSRNTTYMLGYSKSFNWGQLTVNVSRFNNKFFANSTQTSVGVNIPIGGPSKGTNLSTSVSHSTSGTKQAYTTLNGALNNSGDNSLYYSLYGSRSSYSDGSDNTSGGGSLQYDGRYAQFSGNASASSDGVKQVGMNISGAVVVHSKDVSFTRNQGDTFAIVHAPGAEGATVNGAGVVNSRGYGVASSLYPYRENMVSIDPQGASLDVEIMRSSKNIAPTQGAIVLLEYETRSGKAVLLDVVFENGKRPPLGSSIYNEKKEVVAQIGQMGRAFIRGVDESEKLTVSWASGHAGECHFDLGLVDANNDLDGSLFGRRRVICQ